MKSLREELNEFRIRTELHAEDARHLRDSVYREWCRTPSESPFPPLYGVLHRLSVQCKDSAERLKLLTDRLQTDPPDPDTKSANLTD